jgi:hypothetical protein
LSLLLAVVFCVQSIGILTRRIIMMNGVTRREIPVRLPLRVHGVAFGVKLTVMRREQNTELKEVLGARNILKIISIISELTMTLNQCVMGAGSGTQARHRDSHTVADCTGDVEQNGGGTASDASEQRVTRGMDDLLL